MPLTSKINLQQVLEAALRKRSAGPPLMPVTGQRTGGSDSTSHGQSEANRDPRLRKGTSYSSRTTGTASNAEIETCGKPAENKSDVINVKSILKVPMTVLPSALVSRKSVGSSERSDIGKNNNSDVYKSGELYKDPSKNDPRKRNPDVKDSKRDRNQKHSRTNRVHVKHSENKDSHNTQNEHNMRNKNSVNQRNTSRDSSTEDNVGSKQEGEKTCGNRKSSDLRKEKSSKKTNASDHKDLNKDMRNEMSHKESHPKSIPNHVKDTETQARHSVSSADSVPKPYQSSQARDQTKSDQGENVQFSKSSNSLTCCSDSPTGDSKQLQVIPDNLNDGDNSQRLKTLDTAPDSIHSHKSQPSDDTEMQRSQILSQGSSNNQMQMPDISESLTMQTLSKQPTATSGVGIKLVQVEAGVGASVATERPVQAVTPLPAARPWSGIGSTKSTTKCMAMIIKPAAQNKNDRPFQLDKTEKNMTAVGSNHKPCAKAKKSIGSKESPSRSREKREETDSSTSRDSSRESRREDSQKSSRGGRDRICDGNRGRRHTRDDSRDRRATRDSSRESRQEDSQDSSRGGRDKRCDGSSAIRDSCRHRKDDWKDRGDARDSWRDKRKSPSSNRETRTSRSNSKERKEARRNDNNKRGGGRSRSNSRERIKTRNDEQELRNDRRELRDRRELQYGMSESSRVSSQERRDIRDRLVGERGRDDQQWEEERFPRNRLADYRRGGSLVTDWDRASLPEFSWGRAVHDDRRRQEWSRQSHLNTRDTQHMSRTGPVPHITDLRDVIDIDPTGQQIHRDPYDASIRGQQYWRDHP